MEVRVALFFLYYPARGTCALTWFHTLPTASANLSIIREPSALHRASQSFHWHPFFPSTSSFPFLPLSDLWGKLCLRKTLTQHLLSLCIREEPQIKRTINSANNTISRAPSAPTALSRTNTSWSIWRQGIAGGDFMGLSAGLLQLFGNQTI